MGHGVTAYGHGFRLDHQPYDCYLAAQGWAQRRYVSKINAAVFIRSTSDSEHWTVFVAGPAGAAFPQDGGPYDTLREAMPHATRTAEVINAATAPKVPCGEYLYTIECDGAEIDIYRDCEAHCPVCHSTFLASS